MTFVALDIETTGLTADDQITVLGTAADDTARIAYVSDEDVDESAIEHALGAASYHRYDSEERLLADELDALCDDHQLQIESNMVVGYNSGKFDVPMLRTRCAIQDIAWGLAGVNSIDLSNVYKYEWRTTATDVSGFNKKPLRQFGQAVGAPVNKEMYKSELAQCVKEHGYTNEQLMQFTEAQSKDVPTSSKGTLDGIHELIVGTDVHDPFDSSQEAVTAYLDGDVESVIEHNLSDLKKTLDLVGLVEEYVPQDALRVSRL